MARFYRSRRALALRPIDSTKNVFDTSGILPAGVNTVLATPVLAVDSAALANSNNVERGCKVTAIYLSIFFYSESGGGAAQVPLTDWYICHDPQNQMQDAGFVVNGLPTPGATGTHRNKHNILHEEKGLSGQQAAGSPPMVFQGVIRIPRGRQQFSSNDTVVICARANFDTKFCVKAIYKWYR